MEKKGEHMEKVMRKLENLSKRNVSAYSKILLSAGVLLFNSDLFSEETRAILGGANDTTGYTATVQTIANPAGDGFFNPGGGPISADPISPSPAAYVTSVDLNSSGLGLIGGNYGLFDANSVGAYVFLDNSVVPLNTLTVNESVNWVTLNDSGIGILAGSYNALPPPMVQIQPIAHFVTQDGTVTDLTGVIMSQGSFSGASINDSGKGLLGGRNGFPLSVGYLGWVQYPDPAFNDISPANTRRINAVSINNLNIGLVGGKYSAGAPGGLANTPYLARVNSDNTVTPISLGFTMMEDGELSTVSINNSGAGLIGGVVSSTGYAARVGSNNVISVISLPVNAEIIYSVKINNAGEGLIGGANAAFTIGYASRMASDGTVKQLSLPGYVTDIYSVDISNTGVGVIGGDKSNDLVNYTQYAALIAPNGSIHEISNLLTNSNTWVSSVAISPNGLADLVTPASVGPYNSVFNSVLAASFSLQSHINMHHKRLWKLEETKNGNVAMREETSLAIANSPQSRKGGNVSMEKMMVQADNLALAQPLAIGGFMSKRRISGQAETAQAEKSTRVFTPEPKPHYSVWLSPFYDFVHVKERGKIPSYNNKVMGALAIMDYTTDRNDVFGGGVAYAYNAVHYMKSLGHAHINEEMGVLFASFQRGRIFVNGTVWGGLYQWKNKRRSLLPTTSTSKTHGWILSPHFELSGIAYRNQADWLALEAFLMADWVNSWQKHFKERGSSGFNLVMPHRYSSLLRSEAGLRLYEKLSYNWGQVLMEEKASYINQKPFHAGSATTAFVGSASNFTVAVDSSAPQNLGGVEFTCSFVPKNTKYPYGSVNLQGEFGSSLQSYFVGVEIGQRF